MRALILVTAFALLGCEGGGSSDPAAAGAPPASAKAPEHAQEVATAARRGHDLFFGKAVCSTCHRVGDEGAMVVGPNLGVGDEMKDPISIRAAARKPGVEPAAYIIESILDPDAVVSDGYAPGVMKSPFDIPIELTDDDLVALAAFLLTADVAVPVTADALKHAREAIAPARASRERRRPGATRNP